MTCSRNIGPTNGSRLKNLWLCVKNTSEVQNVEPTNGSKLKKLVSVCKNTIANSRSSGLAKWAQALLRENVDDIKAGCN